MQFLKRIFKGKKIKPPIPQEMQDIENCYVSKAKQVIWRNVEGRGVILNVKNALYYTVERAGLRIWELIDKGINVSELVKTISDEYGKDVHIIKRDIKKFLDSMKNEGIIELKTEEDLSAEKKET